MGLAFPIPHLLRHPQQHAPHRVHHGADDEVQQRRRHVREFRVHVHLHRDQDPVVARRRPVAASCVRVGARVDRVERSPSRRGSTRRQPRGLRITPGTARGSEPRGRRPRGVPLRVPPVGQLPKEEASGEVYADDAALVDVGDECAASHRRAGVHGVHQHAYVAAGVDIVHAPRVQDALPARKWPGKIDRHEHHLAASARLRQLVAPADSQPRHRPVGQPALVQLALVEHGEERDEHVLADRGLDPRRELRLRLLVHAVVDAHVASPAVLALYDPLGARSPGIRLERLDEVLHDCRLRDERVELDVGGIARVDYRDVNVVRAEEARGLEQAIVVDQRHGSRLDVADVVDRAHVSRGLLVGGREVGPLTVVAGDIERPHALDGVIDVRDPQLRDGILSHDGGCASRRVAPRGLWRPVLCGSSPVES
mmetsp:Transcript_4533/g.18646  ORF Transcript_4533/g.18646 Transcript_4533/m.18646 type:complete len:425 (-) Transcript_4533:1101-2375(-)